MVINRSNKRWSYKDGAFDKLGNRNSAEFGILWFLLCYKFNGSAPIEIAKLQPTQHYLSSEGATVAGLASLLARSPNTIATYIAQIKRDEDVASMVENMPI